MNPGSGPLAFFTADHRACDALWSEIETAANTGDRPKIEKLWCDFDKAMRHHFDMEEQVLFPALEDAMNMHGGGPTAVMRSEHVQMRAVLDQMAGDVSRGAIDALIDDGDTLLMLIQQHNVKEEGMLYPMADARLRPVWEELTARLAKV